MEACMENMTSRNPGSSIPASGTGRPHTQFPFLQSKEESVCRGWSLWHKNRIFERLDFPFLTVNLFRKRLLNNIFFSSMFFKKHSMREQNC
jgi:hypothetical protein